MVQPFDENMARLTAFLDMVPADGELDITSPYRLRVDALFYRARLIVSEEGVRMLVALRKIGGTSQHAALLMQFLKDITIEDTSKYITSLRTLITECDTKNLKRLEAEVRLIQLYFHMVLHNVGKTSELEVDASLKRILELCQTYPDTAGLLVDTYNTVKDVIRGRRSTSNMYAKDSVDTWWSWPKHHVGNLQHCQYGHPYSGTTWDSCPECGKEVPRPEGTSPNDFLKELDFVAAMKATKMDQNSYRA